MHVLICGGGVIGVSIAPARWRGTGSPPTTAWSARSARSPGLQLRPLYRWHQLCGRDRTYTRVQKSPEIRISGGVKRSRRASLAGASDRRELAGAAEISLEVDLLGLRYPPEQGRGKHPKSHRRCRAHAFPPITRYRRPYTREQAWAATRVLQAGPALRGRGRPAPRQASPRGKSSRRAGRLASSATQPARHGRAGRAVSPRSTARVGV